MTQINPVNPHKNSGTDFIIVLILQVMKVRPREVKSVAQGHTCQVQLPAI